MDEPRAPEAGDDRVEVVVRGLSLDLLRHAQAWDDALLREVQLMARGGHRDERVDLDELWADLDRIQAVFAALRPPLAEALAGGGDHGELRLVVDRPTTVLAAEALGAFSWLDARCGGVLLLSPPSAQVRGLRTWFLEQVTDQPAGRAPVAWEDWRDDGDGRGRPAPAEGTPIP